MRYLFSLSMLACASLALIAAQADTTVEVQGPHICCGQCKNVASALLAKVEGVSDVKPDTGVVVFKAKDAAAAKAGFKALVDGGFFGKATAGGKEIKLDLPAAPKGKADEVTVKDVHVCCGACQKAINKLFPDAKVSYEGKGAQRTVVIKGSGLEKSAVLEALEKTGFYGKVQ